MPRVFWGNTLWERFQNRHNAAAGESPWFYEPKYFVSKRDVDATGARISAARKKPARKYHSQVPSTVLDECEKSYEAADEKKEKTHGRKFDDTGLMALVCRHDVVLFLANIDTPGEQQKYAIALLERFYKEIPENATVAAFYDIVYNPRLREGLGLSEGEGTEHVWSKFRKLIGVTRSSARARRIWLLDLHADTMNRSTREELGSWIRGRLKHGVEARTSIARKELENIEVGKEELRAQWGAQKLVQLSVKKHAPVRLKKDLDSVLNLQTELNTVEASLARLQANISESGEGRPHTIVHEYIASLKQTHARSLEKVEGLYTSLNVSKEFPELSGLPLAFVRLLLMARDLKINIRKRAIGSFFEWDKLNRAAGGRDQPLGTKLHQQTQKAIARRTPALTTAIRKFNAYCEQLAGMQQQEWKLRVPIPSPLPTELAILRDDPSLLADVWITPTPIAIPRWLQDVQVRQDVHFAFLLKQRKEELLLLRLRWRTPLVSDFRFQSVTEEASRIALQLTGVAEQVPIQWVHIPFQDDFEDEEAARDLEGTGYTEEVVIAHDTLEQMLADEDSDSDINEFDLGLSAVSRSSPTYSDDLDMVGRRLLLADKHPISYGPKETREIPLPAIASPQGSFHGSRILHPTSVYPRRFLFPAPDLARLRRPHNMLTDDCINTGAEVLVRYMATESATCQRRALPTVLSTRVMTLYREGADTDAIWRDAGCTNYWQSDIWLIPIHHPLPDLHWTLVAVYLTENPPCIAYFNSFGSKTRWEADAEVKALQTNAVDCGVWVLACIAALLQGYTGLQLTEEEIAQFRVRLFHLFVLSSLPVITRPPSDLVREHPLTLYGDGQRLACLGHKDLEAAYTDVLFNKRPMLKADELRETVDALQKDVEKWVEGYKWRDKVRHTSEVELKAPQETRILFDWYVGAVFVGAGYKDVRDWIGALVDPQANPNQAPQGLPSEPEYRRVKVESPSLGVGTGFGHSLPGYLSYPGQNYFQHSAQSFGQQPPQPFGQPPPPPPGNSPPPLPMHNPLAPAQPHSAFLPLFNQTAQQRCLEVQYPAQFSGPPHAGRWTAACLALNIVVNGMEKGIGTGPSKQLAKEEAAWHTYHNMGWAPRAF
ncbi:hypothetical protein C8Q77DRAFT_1074880 [Trametes polyzona]|nr:hypothetical protein C8Q77DRAFT_1074880 [Trametes polyzona]